MNLFAIDGLHNQKTYGLETDTGQYVQLSASAYQLLQLIAEGASYEQIAELVGSQQGTVVQPEAVRTAHQHILDQIAHSTSPTRPSITGFWFRRTLIPASLVNRGVPPLMIFFHPLVALVTIAFIVGLLWLTLRDGIHLAHMHAEGTSLLLLLISAIVHELGHATACQHFGARPREIGFVVYLTVPTVYTDVTDAWRLTRWQRVVVDLAGVYFQLALGAIYMLGFFLTDWEPFLDTFVLILLAAIYSLNPIFKFDGYWVLSDLLGVTNLSQQPRRLLKHWYDRYKNRPTEPLPWPPAIIRLIAIYTIAAVVFWVYFLQGIIPALWLALRAYPAQLTFFVDQLSIHPWQGYLWQSMFRQTITVIITLYILATLGNLLWRFGSSLLQRINLFQK